MGPYQRATLAAAAASAWLSVRLQLLAAALILAVAALAAAAAGAPSAARGDSGGAGADADADAALRASLVGLSLAYTLPLVGLLNSLISSAAETEQELVSVERIQEYVEGCPSEATHGAAEEEEMLRGPAAASAAAAAALASSARGRRGRGGGSGGGRGHAEARGDVEAPAAGAGRAPPGWPAVPLDVPAISFEGVWLRYGGSPSAPPALRGLSLAVAQGCRLGVCGRTGAGKSSLVAALLRLTPVSAGRVRVLGADAAALRLPELRRLFAVVPQSPALFSGSVRGNLDPLGECAGGDGALAELLRAVRLWAPLCREAARLGRCGGGLRAGGAPGVPDSAAAAAAASEQVVPAKVVLDMPLGGDAGARLSAGQQQLLCLARALARRARLVLLDECTSRVDAPTAALMARVLRERFGRGHSGGGNGTAATATTSSSSGSPDLSPPVTVVEIAHDLRAILDYDRVVLMDRGAIIEDGAPRALAAAGGSRFARLLARAGAGAGAAAAPVTGAAAAGGGADGGAAS